MVWDIDPRVKESCPIESLYLEPRAHGGSHERVTSANSRQAGQSSVSLQHVGELRVLGALRSVAADLDLHESSSCTSVRGFVLRLPTLSVE